MSLQYYSTRHLLLQTLCQVKVNILILEILNSTRLHTKITISRLNVIHIQLNSFLHYFVLVNIELDPMGLSSWACIKPRPQSFPNLKQVLPVPKCNHKKFNDAVVSISRYFTARSDILVEKKNYVESFTINIFATCQIF